jgi:hypothetical protein
MQGLLLYIIRIAASGAMGKMLILGIANAYYIIKKAKYIFWVWRAKTLYLWNFE